MHLHDIASATMNAETAIVHINYILLYKIFCYFCILLTIANAQVVELQFLKVRSFRDILRYLENSWRYLEKFWRYLENFWRYLELFSRISRKIFRPNLGIFVSEPIIRLASFFDIFLCSLFLLLAGFDCAQNTKGVGMQINN